MSPQVRQFWEAFCNEYELEDIEPFDIMKIGSSPESAEEGLALILSGAKTTTSSLPEEFSDGRCPCAGDLSIVLDGHDQPGAVIETRGIEAIPFDQVNSQFAYDYGEWDQTLETWRRKNREYYQSLCKSLGIDWHDQRILLCETFCLVHRHSDQQQLTKRDESR